MPQLTDETPFLADNERDGQSAKRLPANCYFRRPLKFLAILNSVLSISIFVLLIVIYVLLRNGPFVNTWSSEESVQNLAIVLFVNFLLTTPTIFFSIPILLNIASHITMSVLVLLNSSKIFIDAWPDENTCSRRQGPPNWDYAPGKPQCLRAKSEITIMLGVSGGFGLLIGLLVLAILLLRVVALARTKFWKNHKNKFTLPCWNPTGFTVQFTLSVLPGESRQKAASVEAPVAEEEARLIET